MRNAVVLVGLGCALIGALLDRRGSGAWALGRQLDAVTVAAALLIAAGALLTTATSRRVRGFGGMLAAAGLVPLGIVSVETVAGGLPGPSSAVLTLGLTVAFAGAVVRVCGPDRPSSPRPVVTVGVAALATAALAVAASAVVVDLPVRATTAAPVAVAAVPGRPSTIGWRWAPGEPVRDVRAAGAGVVAALAEAVVALDGRDGTERWRFARAGAPVSALVASPDGATVAIVHRSRVSDAAVLTVLDAVTGERRWETGVTDLTTPLLTDTVIALDEPLGGEGPVRYRLTAHALDTGQHRWTWDPPDACDHTVLRSLTMPAVVPVQTACGGDQVLRGLDDRTGTERWATTVSTTAPDGTGRGPGLPPDSGPDGVVLVVSADSGFVTLDPATGRVLGPTPPGFPRVGPAGQVVVVDGEPERLVATLHPATGAVTDVAAACPGERAAAPVGGSVVRICRADNGYEVQVDGGPQAGLGPFPQYGGRGLDPLRDEFVVPGPGAVVVGVAGSGELVGLR